MVPVSHSEVILTFPTQKLHRGQHLPRPEGSSEHPLKLPVPFWSPTHPVP